MNGMRGGWLAIGCAVLTWAVLTWVGGPASAEPMRLDDPTPRWVVVQFEDSPSEHPERLDRVYTKPFAAWLEPDARGRVTVRVDGEILEKSLFFDRDPVPGSFSDYVWVFEPDSGDVVSASFTGAFAYSIDWGFATTEVLAHVEARMGTTGEGGIRGPEPVWGQRLHAWCTEPGRDGCRSVERRSYDAARGYVNAIGYLSIDSPVTRFSTFSAVGEARFSEAPRDVPTTPAVASATGRLGRGDDGALRTRLRPSPALGESRPAGARLPR